MQTLEQSFAEDQIVRELCKSRIHVAANRNEALYVSRMLGSHRQYADDQEVLGTLLPPREVWSTFKPPHRRRIVNVDLRSLLMATFSLRASSPNLPWVRRQNDFIDRIRSRVMNSQPIEFSRPRIRWKLKKKNEYRALAQFNLEDNLICKLSGQYLKAFVDPGFEDSSFAFRAPGANGKTMRHHDAFEKLYQIRKAAGNRKLFVAECDIRGFFDSVDHEVAMAAFHRVVALVHSKYPGRTIHPRLAEIFMASLNCYSFPHNVIEETTPLMRAEDGQDAHFPWPAEALKKHHSNPSGTRIGIPQGGPLSGIIANLVLDLTDKRMKTFPRVGYVRYCDDMVLVAPTEKECRIAFETYLEALDGLKLPYHEPRACGVYGKKFWSDGIKSRAPYCWGAKNKPTDVPWVPFVGYQIRYDGLVRVKPKSVEKHIKALRETVDTVKYGLPQRTGAIPRAIDRSPMKASQSQVHNSMTSKLTSMGVGRVDAHHPKFEPLPKCWANGFRALQGKPIVPTFLKRLDRERERQIRRFKRAGIFYGTGIAAQPRRNWQNPVGYLFSYSAQFKNVGGEYLIKHPGQRRKLKDWLRYWLIVFKRVYNAMR